MKLQFIAILSALFLFSCTDTAKKEDPTELIQRVETNLCPPVFIEGDSTWTIEERMEHYGVPGVSIAVIHNGEIAWTKTYGYLDRDNKQPVTKTTPFQAASISKPVSAYGALTLVEAGKIDLTANINDQLTEYQLAENEFTVDKKVSVKNLLNHSGGVNVHGFLGYRPGLEVPTLLQILNGQAPANSDSLLVNKVPEESFRYSGGGYNIVQQLMIEKEGKSFPEIMDERVLQPLGMRNSTFAQPLPETRLKEAPTGYLPDGTVVKGRRHTYPEMAPAGLWTTPEDLAKFAINIQETLKGKSDKALSTEMTELMLTPFVDENVGLGIFLKAKKDEMYFGHGGWNEGFSSELIAHKDKGYGAVVMINSNHPAFISELIRAVALTYGWDDYFSRYKEVENAEALPSDALGKYVVRGFDYLEVVNENGQLMYRDGPEEELLEFVQISDSTYVVREYDVLFQFRENEGGGLMDIHILDPNTMETRDAFTHLSKDEKLPIEILLEGDYEGALEEYKAIMKADSDDPNVNENHLNVFGYRFLGVDKAEIAKQIFAVNMELYPESFNVYDSYAEACMVLGEDSTAIEYYEKSLELNPENENASNMIARIREGQ